MTMKWYKRDPDAALIGFRGLSHDAKSAYGTIIDLSYSRDGNVPDDEHFLCTHIECRPQWWRRVKAELITHGKIRTISGKLVANRVETTLKEAENYAVSWKNNSKINGKKIPTTTRYIREDLNFKDKGVEYRAPPHAKSNNKLKPLPDKQAKAKP